MGPPTSPRQHHWASGAPLRIFCWCPCLPFCPSSRPRSHGASCLHLGAAGQGCPTLMPMLGARVAMASWIARATMLEPVWPVASGPSATTPYATWCLSGHPKRGSGLKRRPPTSCCQSPDDTSTPQRRPADLFIPALGAAAAASAHHKETYFATAQTCERQGILFLPMVVETTGNWDARAYKVLRHIAQGVASRTGTDHATTLSMLLQEASVVARGFRARAALRRRAELASE